MSISIVNTKKGTILMKVAGYVYEIPAKGDWVAQVRALQEGSRIPMPGVNVLGLDVEWERIVREYE